MTTTSATLPDNPPSRSRLASLPALVFAVCAGPVAWSAQLVLSYGLASHACFPGTMPLTGPAVGFAQVWAVLLIINVLAAVVALAAAVSSLRHWDAARSRHALDQAIAAREGRTRFLTLCGSMMGFGFLAAVLFDTIALFVVPPCSG